MTREEITDKVSQLLCEHLGVNKDEIVDDANLVEDLGADSLDEVEIAMTLEQEFDIEISDEQIGAINTVGKIIDFIENACVK